MAAPIVRNKRSSVVGKIPTTTNITLGEFAINTTDGKVYIVQETGGTGIGTTVMAVNPWSVGSGTTTYNTYFTAGNVGVGITDPQTKLEIDGVLGFNRTNIQIGDDRTGGELWGNPTSGFDNIFIGNEAGAYQDGGNRNIFVGTDAGHENIDGDYNVYIGDQAGYHNITGNDNVSVGGGALYYNETGIYNVAIGRYSGEANTVGAYNVYLGGSSGYNNSNGSYNIYLGYKVANSTDTSGNIVIGYGTSDGSSFTAASTTKDKQFAIGVNTTGTNEYWLVGDENLNIGIGTIYPTQKLHVGGDIQLDNDLRINNNILFSSSTVRIGSGAGQLDEVSGNIFIGVGAGAANTTGKSNIFIGDGQNGETGSLNSSGSHNIFIGDSAGEGNSTGSYNIFFGSYVGTESSFGDGLDPSYKILIGQGYGDVSYFNSPDPSKSYQFAVGIVTDGSGNTNYWLVGDENYNIGIGTTNPTTKLQVGGTVKATSFIGDGSGLTGITASGTSIAIENDGVYTGLATAINFADNLSVTFSSGVARVSGFSTTAAGIFKTVTQYTATAGQTTFSATYVVGYVDVYMNGVRLSETEYTATDGTSIVLDEGASINDVIDIVAFSVNLTSVTNSTNVIGGIGSITRLQVAGISTFTNGPVLIGSATSTGTSAQRLQVTGGAYFSSIVGIGTTNPSTSSSGLSIVNTSGGSLLSLSNSGGTNRKELLFTIDTTNNNAQIESLQQGIAYRPLLLNSGGGPVGIGTTSATSRLHIIGGTTAANTAPLEIASGSLLNTIESDVFEYDGVNIYHTNNDTTNGFGRAVIPEVQFRRLAVTNSVGTAASSIFGAGIGTFSVLQSRLYEFECYFYVTKSVTGVSTFSFNVTSGNFTSLSAVLSPITTGVAGTSVQLFTGAALQGATANNSTITSVSLTDTLRYAGNLKGTFIPSSNAKFTIQAQVTGSLSFLPDSYIKLVGYASTLRAGNVT